MSGREKEYYLDTEMLRKHHACDSQVFLYRKIFGNGRVFLSLANVERAIRAGLQIRWLARWLHESQPRYGEPWDIYQALIVLEGEEGNAEEVYGLLKRLAHLWAVHKAEQSP